MINPHTLEHLFIMGFLVGIMCFLILLFAYLWVVHTDLKKRK